MSNHLLCQKFTASTLWALSAFLLVPGAPLVTGISLSPCGAEGIREILHDQSASFNCTAEGEVQWKLQYNGTDPFLLSACKESCVQSNSFGGLFTTRAIDFNTSILTINPATNTGLHKYVQFLNATLECTKDNISARCGLDYVHSPERVECTASNIAWSVNVSCEIGSIFSLRGIYKCQLIRNYNESERSTLESVAIVTSPTMEKIIGNEVKMSGVCQFNTTLPAEEGIYSYSVSISPGIQTFKATAKLFTVERPRRPYMSCYSQPYVLENTEVNCTCSTTSLGQPAGLLTWITGNQTNYRIEEDKRSVESRQLFYKWTLTLLDHNNTWFRCDVTWLTETIQGSDYTAQVGYAARTPRLFEGGKKEPLNQTVIEGDLVHSVCQSDGRPTPTVHIYSLDNNTDVWSDSSPGNFTFIARCEDAATYKCYAKNSYSTQSNVNTSVGLDLYVRCKPRDVSVTDLGKVTFGNKTEEINFDVVAYPVPHEYVVWFVGRERNNSTDIAGEVKDSEMNVTCKVHVQHRFLSTCTLAIFSVPFNSGFYKIQMVNEYGDQNFTVEIGYGTDYDEPPRVQIAVIVGVAVAVVLIITVVVVIVVTVKRKRKESSTFERIECASTNSQNLDWNNSNGEGGQLVQAPEIIYETPWDTVPSRAQGLDMAIPSYSLQPCQAPLYAVVEKMKKANKKGTEDKEFSESFRKETDALYAVVDKVRGKALAKRAKGQRADRDQSPKARKDPCKKVGPTKDGAFCTDDGGADYVNKESFAMHPLLSQSDASGMRNGSSSASRPHEPNDGRWENDDGLIYTLPAFDARNYVRRPPAPRSEETEYCTLREMENKFPALDKR